MARSAITVTELSAYNSSADITKDAIDLTNNHSIDVSGLSDERIQIYLETTTAPVDFVFKAGDYEDGVLGDLTVSATGAGTKVIEIETSRFKDSDELVLIDASSTGSGAGNIYVTANVQAK